MSQDTSPTEMVLKKRWGAEQRLEFIEFTSFWDGEINRSAITDQFGVSPQQASTDLSAYQAIAPDNLRYDLKSKRYIATQDFQCKLISPNADRYLGQLTALSTHTIESDATWLTSPLAADAIPIPSRRVDPEVLRHMLQAVRSKKSLEIEYRSINSANPEPTWRRITPHAFGSDGFRWHVRAFCHKDERFKDFLLSRCCGTRQEGGAGAPPDSDALWNTYFQAKLGPNPQLTEVQRRAIEEDYAMINGIVQLSIRYALLYYFNKRFRADFAPTGYEGKFRDPRETPIVILNFDAYEKALASTFPT
jgi:hypothetical protein